MKPWHFVLVTTMLCLNPASAQDFPTAPVNLKEAQIQGLVRVTAEELKAFFPGVIDLRGPTGEHTMIYKADGSLERKGFRDKPGSWRIDEGRNAYCNLFPRRMGAPTEACFAVFRAADGRHYFDYDLRDGFYAHVWRRAAAE